VGVEPAGDAAEAARKSGRKVIKGTIQDVSASEPFDTVTLINVLEHVPEPLELLASAKAVIRSGGALGARVPNDYSPLREAAAARLQAASSDESADPWWVVAPDHVNYFNRDSLSELIERAGFRVTATTADFPMELFLLMGYDYVGQPQMGAECHSRRRRLELALPADLRRSWCASMAALGLGRNLLVSAIC
jgi:SAM-dependent methyltransferase